jgi:glucose/arabinose dehydrogenase
MKKQLLLALGTLLLLTGWLSAFLLNSVPQQKTFFILGPTLLLGIGMGIVWKTVGGKLTALTLALTALTALLTMNQMFPSSGVSISAFQKRTQNDRGQGIPVPILVDKTSKNQSRIRDRELEAFSPVEITLFAQLPGAPGGMTFNTQEQLFVSIPKLGAVYRLTDSDQDGFSEQAKLYHVGMDRPTGLAWFRGTLYVAEPSQLLKIIDVDEDGQADQGQILVSGLPDDGGHWTRPLLSDTQKRLYLAIGSRCNNCEEENLLRATVLQIEPETGEYAIFARGLRNVAGLVFSSDNRLWGSDVGRTGLGSDMQTNEINLIALNGDYGWPYCFGHKQSDPQFAQEGRCENTQPSRFDLPGNLRPQGLAFGAKLKTPDQDRDYLYVAVDTDPAKIIRIPYVEGRILPPAQPFLQGWGAEDNSWGLPADMVAGEDGCMYVSDRRAHNIYRICWKEEE